MSWQQVRESLNELAMRRPTPLLSYPDPKVTRERRGPHRIRLQPWAPRVAEDLRSRHPGELALSVGNFSYPDREWVDRSGGPGERPAFLSEQEIPVASRVRLYVAGPEGVVVLSGYETRAAVRVTNAERYPLELRPPTCEIVDALTGRLLGGPIVAPPAPPRELAFRVRAGQSVLVPLRVGTSSYDPGLGFAVAPGSWALRVFVEQAPATSAPGEPDPRAEAGCAEPRTIFRAPLVPIAIKAHTSFG